MRPVFLYKYMDYTVDKTTGTGAGHISYTY